VWFGFVEEPLVVNRPVSRKRLTSANVVFALALFVAPVAHASQRGTPEAGSVGVKRTMLEIATAGVLAPPSPHRTLPFRTNPSRRSQAAQPGVSGPAPAPASRARTAVTSTLNFAGPTLTDSGAFPPDTMGAVGPSQFIVAINGRFRSYDKATGVADGALDVDPDVFFSSVMTPPTASNFTSDPHIRYDRLSQRWIIVMIDVPGTVGDQENRVLVAVSDGSVITGSTVWTFFDFAEDAGGPNESLFADYPTLGVDANALYIGMNMFTLAGNFSKTNMYVVRKSSILGAGPIVVSRFTGATGTGAGPYTPQGVDDFDPAETTGYFIGVDNAVFGKLDVRKVTDPGGTPTMSGDLAVTVPATAFPIPVDHLGNTGGASGRLDALDDRLFAAQLRGGHIWTAHNIGVNSSGVASGSPTRDASRWYEVDVTGTPALTQSGTLFDGASSNPKSYWIPTVAVSGEGVMAIGGSVAGLLHHADAWFSGRLPGDPAGQTDTPTEYTATTASYNPSSDPCGSFGRRWGDYSMTSVDPTDDMTMWTIQEYVSSNNIWGTRVVRLKAPPPATPASPSPPNVAPGQASTIVALGGTSSGGSAYFDPGPGFDKRLSVAVGCGITVNSVTFNGPTSLSLDLDTTAAAGSGPCDVTVTNPDGQVATAPGLLQLGSQALRELTVSRSGTGSGTVTSIPSGIDCGTTCQANFDDGTSVTLHASAASGSSFTGWSGGGCLGTGDCTLTMDAAKSVTASFDAAASGGAGGSGSGTGGGGSGTGGGGGAGAADTTAPLLKLSFKRVQSLRTVLKRGVGGKASCTETCVARFQLRLPRSAAKSLHLAARYVTIARVTMRLAANRTTGVRIKLSRKVRRRLAHVRRIRLQLIAQATDLAGNRAKVLVRTVTLKG
jgi:Divergent InlB B-repeat domain